MIKKLAAKATGFLYLNAMRSGGKPKCVVVADVVLVYEERTTDR